MLYNMSIFPIFLVFFVEKCMNLPNIILLNLGPLEWILSCKKTGRVCEQLVFLYVVPNSMRETYLLSRIVDDLGMTYRIPKVMLFISCARCETLNSNQCEKLLSKYHKDIKWYICGKKSFFRYTKKITLLPQVA